MVKTFLTWASRVVLAGVFLYGGYTKLQAELQFASAIAGYRLLPDKLILPVASYLPWLEIILGLLLLTGWYSRFVAGFAGALLAFFIIIMTITYFRGIEADCGCFGVGERISPLTIARDSLFLIPAIFLLLEPRFRRPRETVPETRRSNY